MIYVCVYGYADIYARKIYLKWGYEFERTQEGYMGGFQEGKEGEIICIISKNETYIYIDMHTYGCTRMQTHAHIYRI